MTWYWLENGELSQANFVYWAKHILADALEEWLKCS